jgi:hypothetical protein
MSAPVQHANTVGDGVPQTSTSKRAVAATGARPPPALKCTPRPDSRRVPLGQVLGEKRCKINLSINVTRGLWGVHKRPYFEASKVGKATRQASTGTTVKAAKNLPSKRHRGHRGPSQGSTPCGAEEGLSAASWASREN